MRNVEFNITVRRRLGRSRRSSSLVVLLVLSTPAGPAEAEGTAPEHGKVFTGDATPVGAGVLELEMSYAPNRAVRQGWGSFEDSATAYEHAWALSATWGPTDDLDFSFETGYVLVHDAGHHETPDAHGHADDALGLRYRFLSTGALDLAAISGWTLPTGADGAARRLGASQQYVSWNNALVASWDADRATGNVEIGFSLPLGSNRGEARGVMVANVAVGYHVLDWLQPEVELNYEHDLNVGPDPEVLAGTAGVVAPWGEGNRVTAGVQQALWGRGTAAFTGASIAYKAAF